MEEIYSMFINSILVCISNLLRKSDSYININIAIPKETVLRTQLMCKYISEEENCDFDLNTFIMLLYLDFVRESIEHYNPQKVLKQLTFDYVNNKSLLISNGSDSYQVNNNISYSNYSIEFDIEEAEKGQLILNELFELFHIKISFNKLIEQIWISFIYKYKTGDNKKAFSYLRNILKANLN